MTPPPLREPKTTPTPTRFKQSAIGGYTIVSEIGNSDVSMTTRTVFVEAVAEPRAREPDAAAALHSAASQ